MLTAGLRVHSTRSVAASWAAWKEAALEDICPAASWALGDNWCVSAVLDVTS